MLIHLFETLSYAVRYAGVRTGRLAVALSLTGIIVLVSRTSNLLQGPMTGKIIDYAKQHPGRPVPYCNRLINGRNAAGNALFSNGCLDCN
nr:DUF2837 family protein [Paenibacillus sp. SDF0028]